MIKFWRVFAYEYLRHVKRKRFIFALISLPLFLLAIMVVSVLSTTLSIDLRPMGYVDHSGLLSREPAVTHQEIYSRLVRLAPFDEEQAAEQALQKRQIQGYFVIDADYLQTGGTRLRADRRPDPMVVAQFDDFLRAHLVTDLPYDVARRLVDGHEVEHWRMPGDDGQAARENWLQLLLPLASGVLFVVVINTSGGYLLQAVVEEKENRTIEIVITSVSYGQLMAGKILGNLSVGLTQLFIWLFFPALGFLVLRRFSPFIGSLYLEPEFAWLLALTLVPAFVLIAALMATIGATATEAREAQQIAGLFTLPVMLPYWFIVQLMTEPQGSIALALSLIPLTAPVSLPLRAAFSDVPLWQSALSISLLWLSALIALWLAGRAFRQGMLNYGKRLSWRELVRR